MSRAQDLKAYQIYNKQERPINFSAMVAQLSKYDVVLFGEYHNNAINHWLELKTTEALYRLKWDRLVLGAEMFERDNQNALNQYLTGAIDTAGLTKQARLWPNFKTDYRPLLNFAKDNNLKFIATNVPRRYAAIVARHGLDSLSKLPAKEKTYIAKLPITVDLKTPGYKEMRSILKKHANSDKIKNFIAAQALKDATMAESILKTRSPGQLFLHYNGNYHSKEYGGIYWYLKKHDKDLKVAVVSVFESDSDALPMPDSTAATEFNIVLPKDMTRTYLASF